MIKEKMNETFNIKKEGGTPPGPLIRRFNFFMWPMASIGTGG